jgi:hypothetical protein
MAPGAGDGGNVTLYIYSPQSSSRQDFSVDFASCRPSSVFLLLEYKARGTWNARALIYWPSRHGVCAPRKVTMGGSKFSNQHLCRTKYPRHEPIPHGMSPSSAARDMTRPCGMPLPRQDSGEAGCRNLLSGIFQRPQRPDSRPPPPTQETSTTAGRRSTCPLPPPVQLRCDGWPP